MDLLRGQIVFASGLGSDAPPLLPKAAKRLEPLNLGLARETYLSAWIATRFAGRLAGAGDVLEVCRAARALPPPKQPHPVDLLLEAALLVTDGPAGAAASRRREAVFWVPVTAVIRRIPGTAARHPTKAATAAVPMPWPRTERARV